MSAVGDLLKASLAAHMQAKQRGVRDPDRAERSRRAWTEARQLRLEAIALDPGRSDPAWEEERGMTPRGRDTHTALLAFYDEVLGR